MTSAPSDFSLNLLERNRKGQSPQGSLFSISVISSHLRDLGYPETSIRSMLKCGCETGYHIIEAHPLRGLSLIPLTYKCSLRTCPRCSKNRKRSFRRKFLPILKKFKPDRLYALRFLTISPRNYSIYKEGYEDIRKNWSKFIRRDYIKERVKGGLFVVEGKQSSDGSWNIHIHAIIYSRRLYNKPTKSRDSVLVREWKNSSGSAVNIKITTLPSLDFTLNYMLKYVGSNKDDFLNPESMAEYIVGTRKKRLVTTFGCFYRITGKDKSPWICEVTGEPIQYFYDPEVVRMLLEIERKPPDIPTLNNYIDFI